MALRAAPGALAPLARERKAKATGVVAFRLFRGAPRELSTKYLRHLARIELARLRSLEIGFS
jgi:hypothetical protein